jgi:hypothetical protein
MVGGVVKKIDRCIEFGDPYDHLTQITTFYSTKWVSFFD